MDSSQDDYHPKGIVVKEECRDPTSCLPVVDFHFSSRAAVANDSYPEPFGYRERGPEVPCMTGLMP